jgi:predicted RNase H-like HicB family nuclease
MKLKLSVIFYPSLEGGYTATCPEVGWSTQGDTYE